MGSIHVAKLMAIMMQRNERAPPNRLDSEEIRPKKVRRTSCTTPHPDTRAAHCRRGAVGAFAKICCAPMRHHHLGASRAGALVLPASRGQGIKARRFAGRFHMAKPRATSHDHTTSLVQPAFGRVAPWAFAPFSTRPCCSARTSNPSGRPSHFSRTDGGRDDSGGVS